MHSYFASTCLVVDENVLTLQKPPSRDFNQVRCRTNCLLPSFTRQNCDDLLGHAINKLDLDYCIDLLSVDFSVDF